ncbi:TetR/AcrR family transcriptional regulator C-terminal domain-containing protein [Clostridiaceae bacterium OttesenSCG-928-D20]|nr:TetR/AcrR family transcriptional regulator C-terminal domain-containing protein [Clostridiaceae bacterium OttesenSCG-928-D20]
MEKKEDRRVKYTKTLIKNALVELMQERHISKISIKLLCERADVHRSTFYAHYADQYAVLKEIVDEVLTSVARYLREQDYDKEHPVSEQNLVKIIQYAKDNTNIFRALFSGNSDSAISSELMSFINDVSFPIETMEDPKMKEYTSLFAINGVVSVLRKWLQEGAQESVEYIAAFLMQILYKGLIGISE